MLAPAGLPQSEEDKMFPPALTIAGPGWGLLGTGTRLVFGFSSLLSTLSDPQFCPPTRRKPGP